MLATLAQDRHVEAVLDRLLARWPTDRGIATDPEMVAMTDAMASIPEPWRVCLGLQARNLRVGAAVFRSYRLPEGEELLAMQMEAREKLARRLAAAGILPPVPSAPRPAPTRVACNEDGRPIGESHHKAQMADAEVDRIRDLHENNRIGYKRLAKMFDRPKSTIRHICQYTSRAQTPMVFKGKKS